MNSIDKVADFLRDETKGYKVITIGSSSGGYLAVLLGCLLQADHVIAFSAQFELRNKFAFDPNPFLQKYEGTERSKYYDLKPLIADSSVPIYYFIPANCDQDIHHWNHVKNVPCVRCLPFKSSHHGVVIYKNNLSKIVSMRKEELEKIYEKQRWKKISVFNFSVEQVGLQHTISYLIKLCIKKMKPH